MNLEVFEGLIEERLKSGDVGLREIADLLYAILCRLRNIEYLSYRGSIQNIGSIERIETVRVGTSPTIIAEVVGIDRVIKVFNVSFDTPQLLFITTGKVRSGLPINVGESESFFIKDGGTLQAYYETGPADVIVAYLTV